MSGNVIKPRGGQAMSRKTGKILKARRVNETNFARFGQVVGPSEDGAVFCEKDAQLQLSNGTPRFYIMRLNCRKNEEGRLSFGRITHHAEVTQCLGGLASDPWYMAVAAPGEDPTEDSMEAFEVPSGIFLKLHVGTWHAGPLFETDKMDFYNLELSDTNITDHHNKDFEEKFVIQKP